MKDYLHSGGDPDILIPDVELDHPIDFDVFYAGVTVKDRLDIYGPNFFQSYTKLYDNYNEIFLNEEDDPNSYYNFSNIGTNCRHPQFFLGESIGPYTYWFYLTWEAFLDNSWQIYYSKIQVQWGGGGVEENNSAVRNIIVFPNPIKDVFEIQFDLVQSTFIEIDLLNYRGQIAANLLAENCSQGNFSQHFVLSESSSKPGIHFIRFKADGRFSYQKVVKVK